MKIPGYGQSQSTIGAGVTTMHASQYDTPLRRQDGSLDVAAYIQRSRTERALLLRQLWRSLFATPQCHEHNQLNLNKCGRS